jgi:hypothetical protein
LRLIDACADCGHPCFVTVLLTQATRADRTEIAEYVSRRWNGEPSFAELVTRNAFDGEFRLSHIAGGAKALVPWSSVEEFLFRAHHNTCSNGNFEIGADGIIRPCAGISAVCGDAGAAGLRRALAGDGLYRFWSLDKGSIDPCKRCALRYACADCTAFEIEGAADARVKQAYCPCDPDAGAPAGSERNWSPPDFVQLLAAAGT